MVNTMILSDSPNMEKHNKITKQIRELIDKDEKVTITLGKSDLIWLHEAVSDEAIAVKKSFFGLAPKEQWEEIQADSISHLQSFAMKVIEKLQ